MQTTSGHEDLDQYQQLLLVFPKTQLSRLPSTALIVIIPGVVLMAWWSFIPRKQKINVHCIVLKQCDQSKAFFLLYGSEADMLDLFLGPWQGPFNIILDLNNRIVIVPHYTRHWRETEDIRQLCTLWSNLTLILVLVLCLF